MTISRLARRRPVSTLVTTAFIVALAATVAYWAGAVPGIPKTLPTFVNLLAVTIVLFVITVLAWGAELSFD